MESRLSEKDEKLQRHAQLHCSFFSPSLQTLSRRFNFVTSERNSPKHKEKQRHRLRVGAAAHSPPREQTELTSKDHQHRLFDSCSHLTASSDHLSSDLTFSLITGTAEGDQFYTKKEFHVKYLLILQEGPNN